MTTYYVGHKVKSRWTLTHVLHMPDRTCLTYATSMMHAALPGYTGFYGHRAECLLDYAAKQKNVRPFDNLPTIQYDVRKYWEYKLAQASITGNADTIARTKEFALEQDGIAL
jgi:hypothetical protein